MFGHPTVQVDEQFYLLVGQRMAQGALPYVDIWDRKPLGLFLIYEAAYLLPGDPVLGYQLLGCACSVATALVIARIAQPLAGQCGAILAGVCYLLWQPVFNVATGQSPVFYNLPMALAAGLAARAYAASDGDKLARRGFLAMALVGIALQIKTSVVFEGAGLGLLLLGRAWSAGWGAQRIAAHAVAWVGAALVPSALVLAAYSAMGHAQPLIDATVMSILERGHNYAKEFVDLGEEVLLLLPFVFAMRSALRLETDKPAYRRALLIWMLFAVSGFLLFGTWHDHYVGPLLVPFSVLAAPALGAMLRTGERGRWAGAVLLVTGAIGCVILPKLAMAKVGTLAEVEAARHVILRELRGRCLYINQGPTALYRLTGACLPTRHVFPSHLSAAREAGAILIDADDEVRRILASRPGVVMVSENGQSSIPNHDSARALAEGLAAGYERYAGLRIGKRRYGFWRPRG